MIVTLLPNRTGRDFILGDLHGAFPSLQALLSHAHFDEHHDRLIATGDLFDKGPAALDCLTLPDKPWFYAVRGNHEDALLAWYFAPDAGAKNRAEEKIAQQGGEWFFTLHASAQHALCETISRLPLVILLSGQNHRWCVIHGEIIPEVNDINIFLASLFAGDRLTLNNCLAGRRRHLTRCHTPVKGIDYVVSGHTSVTPANRQQGNCINLDFSLPPQHPDSALGMLETDTNTLYLCNRKYVVTTLKGVN